MARLLTSVGALAVAAIALAFPAPAKPKGGDVGQCLNLCNQLPINNRGHCQSYCIKTFYRASAAANVRHKPKPRPITVTGAPSRPTQRGR